MSTWSDVVRAALGAPPVKASPEIAARAAATRDRRRRHGRLRWRVGHECRWQPWPGRPGFEFCPDCPEWRITRAG